THAVLTPLGGLWWREDPKAWKLLAPFVYREEGPSKHTTVIFPAFWYDYDHGRQTVCVPPFYTHSDKEQHSNTTTLIPVFFWHREPGSTLLLSLPGVIHAETEEHKNTIVIPLAYWWSRDPVHSAGVAGPWWWSKSRRTGEDRGWHALVPLFFQSHNGDRDFLLTPVAFRWANRNSSIYGFPGFGWATRRDPTSREIVAWNVLLGPLYVRTAPAAADVVLFPLFWHTHDERHAHTALVPLFDYERHGRAWRFVTLGGGGGSDPDLRGDWWWVLNTFSVRRDDERTSAFLPLAYVKQSPRRLQIISPLFFHDEDKVQHSTTTLAPLFFRKTSPQRDTWVAFPLAWWDNDKERGIGVGGVLPVALWMRSKDRDWTAILPLLTYRERRGEDHVYVTGPYIDVSIEGRRSLGVFPIFRYHREDGYSSFVSLPFIFWLKRDGYTRAFVGLGYWNQETGTRLFFPGYVRFQEHDDQHNVTRSVDVAVPGYVHYQTPKKDVKVIGPWYRVKRSDGSSVVGVAIFWYATKRPPDESTWSILGDLVGYQRQGDYSRMTFLWGFHTQPKLVKKKDSSAKPRRFAEEALLEPGC
ncbi:MAG TPA: hypothetical protein VMV18_00110, partial [bacterium]|nr:hypothetical protein [bacterium]